MFVLRYAAIHDRCRQCSISPSDDFALARVFLYIISGSGRGAMKQNDMSISVIRAATGKVSLSEHLPHEQCQ